MSNVVASRIFTRFDERRMLYMPEDPVFAGGKSGSYIFERQHVPAVGHTSQHTFDEHIFMLPMGDAAAPFHSRLNGRPAKGLIEPGRFRFVAVGDTLSTTWKSPTEILDAIFVTLHPGVLHRALGEEGSSPSIELVSNIQPHEDPVLLHLTLAMQSYLRTGRIIGRLFEQSLIGSIALHLMDAYGKGSRGASRSVPLTRWKQARLKEYVSQNLAHDLSLAEIAMAVGMRPHQLSRAFRAATGQSLWQFVLECRAREAMRLMIRSPDMPLSHVATACGFESYPQFIAAFRKLSGQLPSAYRRIRAR